MDIDLRIRRLSNDLESLRESLDNRQFEGFPKRYLQLLRDFASVRNDVVRDFETRKLLMNFIADTGRRITRDDFIEDIVIVRRWETVSRIATISERVRKLRDSYRFEMGKALYERDDLRGTLKMWEKYLKKNPGNQYIIEELKQISRRGYSKEHHRDSGVPITM